MITNLDLERLFQAAKKEGEVLVADLPKGLLERAGFNASTFGNFRYAAIYLIYDGKRYKLKYIFDGDWKGAYYETPRDVGGVENFLTIIENYLLFFVGEKA